MSRGITQATLSPSWGILRRHEIESGEYQFIVSGIAATSNYVVTVYITPERLLNPMEQLVLGQVQIALRGLRTIFEIP